MTQSKEEFIKVLKFELSNLIEDISALIDYEKELHEENKHTHFVYLENLVVLKDEIMGINGIMGFIENYTGDTSDPEFHNKLEEGILDFINKRGYPMAVNDLVKRKISKVIDMKEYY